MDEHCLFLQQEVTLAFVDDFMVLPCVRVWANVYEGVSEYVARHDSMFAFAH